MNDIKNIFHIKMNQFGNNLFVRNKAKEIVERIKENGSFEQFEIILVDFMGVENISSGFAFDLFRILKQEIGEDFLKKIRVKFDKNDESILVRTVVRNVFNTKNTEN